VQLVYKYKKMLHTIKVTWRIIANS